MSGYFLVRENPKEPFDVLCEINEALDGEVPDQQAILYTEIETVSNIIKSLNNTSEESKRKYFDKLLSLSRAGLTSDNAQPQMSMKALEKLKEEMVMIEGRRIKNQYMIRLGTIAFVMEILLLLVFWLCSNQIVHMFIITWSGALVGTWISYGARKFEIKLEDLSVIEKDMMEPSIRLIYIGLCAIIFELFLIIGIVEIKIGAINTVNIKDDVLTQFLLGSICGLVESKLGINIYNRAVSAIENTL